MDSQVDHKNKLLKTYSRNLQILQRQAGAYGGENFIPIHIANQIDETEAKIKELVAEIKALGGTPVAAAPPAAAPPTAEAKMSGPELWPSPSEPAKKYYTCRVRVTNYEHVQLERKTPEGEDMGEPSGKFGYKGALREQIDALLAPPDAPQGAETIKKLGETLFKALFDNELKHKIFDLYNQAVRQEKKLLRIELDIDEKTMPEVAALPWEFLRLPTDANLGAIWFGTAPDVILSRRRAQWHAAPPIQLKSGEKLRIALAVAAPADLETVAFERVHTDLQSLAKAEPNRIELLPLVNPANPETIDAVLSKEPHIFHFIGHAQLQKAGDQHVGRIALVDHLGDADWVEEEYFSELLNEHQPNLIFLQACEGAMATASQAFVGVASRIVQQNIPVVLAMQYEVSNSTASRFARKFYQQLAEGDPVDLAAQNGRRSIALGPTRYKSRDFATPVIFMQVKDGHLFQRT